MKRVFGQRHIGLAFGALLCVPFSTVILAGCGGGGGGSSSIGTNRFKGTYSGTYRIVSGTQAGLTGPVSFTVNSEGKVLGTLQGLANTVPGSNTVGTVKGSTGQVTFKITDAAGHPSGAGTATGTLVIDGSRRSGNGTVSLDDGSIGTFQINMTGTGGTTSGGTTSGSTTSGGTTSGSTTAGGTTSGTTTSGSTTSGNTTSGSTTSGSTTSGNTTSGSTTSGSTTAGTTTSGSTTSGTTTSGGTTSGSTTSGSTTSGSTTSGTTTAGNTTSGSTTSGSTTSGSTTSGSTTSGSTTAGNTTSGSTTAGNTTSGSTTAGNTTSGSTTAGNTTSGSTTAGNTTSGSTTSGSTTSGSTTAGSTTSGTTTSGTTNPVFIPATYQVNIQTTNPSTTVVATIPVNSAGSGTATVVNGLLGSLNLKLQVAADGTTKLTIPGLLGADTTSNIQLAVQPNGQTILGVGALAGPLQGTVTLTKQ